MTTIVEMDYSFSGFLFLIQRNISSDFFFDSLLSDEDLSKLLCTCRSLKEEILKWKNIFPIQEYITGVSLTDKMFENMILHYSRNIIKLTISLRSKQLTVNGYQHVNLLHLNLLELDLYTCLPDGLPIILSTLLNLTSLRIFSSIFSSKNDIPNNHFNFISKLTNLETLGFDSCQLLDDFNLSTYSTLQKMKSIRFSSCYSIKEWGLYWFISNKQLLVEIKICRSNMELSSEEYYCLTILTNLSHLSIKDSNLNDMGLNKICCSCLLLEYLEIKSNYKITKEGFNCLCYLVHLKSFNESIVQEKNYLLDKLSNNVALTHLTVTSPLIDNEGCYNNLSSFFNLTYLSFCGGYGIEGVLCYNLFNLVNLTYLKFNGGCGYYDRNIFNTTAKKSYIYLAPLLSCLVNLTFLDLNQCIIAHDGGLQHLASSSFSLTQLNINTSTVCLNGLSDLSSLTNISHLKMTNSKILREEEYFNLSLCYNLTHLDFIGSKIISEKSLSYISALVQLTHLSINDEMCYEKISTFFFLSSLSNLTNLNLISCTISEIGCCNIAFCVNLTYLNLHESFLLAKEITFLSSLSKLTYLDLGRRSVDNDELIYISSCCVNLTVLKHGNGKKQQIFT